MSQTFLQLVNSLAREAGVSGNASSVSTVVGQTGEANRLVNWIRTTHNDIQNKHDNWRWMRSTFTVNTVAGTDTYAPGACTDSRLTGAISRFSHWIPFDDQGAANIKRYLASGGVGGEAWFVNIPWSYFVSIYRRGTQNPGQPIHITIDPQNNLVLGPKPDGVYTINGEYQMSQLDFSANGDVPEMPVQFQDVIWSMALQKYGRYHAAGEVLSRGQIEGGRLLRQLEGSQLPETTLGSPLV
jgi:hypothetical protein